MFGPPEGAGSDGESIFWTFFLLPIRFFLSVNINLLVLLEM